MHRTDASKPLGAKAVPPEDPNWGYQAERPEIIRLPVNHMVTCLTVGLQKAGHKDFNFDKLREITQRLDENLAQFPAKLKEALRKYTNLGPTSAGGTIVLNIHFISQSSPDIQKKLKKAEGGPQTLNETF